MIIIYKTIGSKLELKEAEKDCWINVINPTKNETKKLISDFGVPVELINDILDVDERPRIEHDDGWTLFIFRIPVEVKNNGVPFTTIPLGVFISKDSILTLCSQDNEVLSIANTTKFSDNINFILHLFLRSGSLYLKYLKQINQLTTLIESDLEKSVKNKELNKLLKMEKCLVYFITSIKANEIVLTKLRSTRKITTEINEDLIEEALIENKQALEMAQIYSNIQSSMMNAFASVISNNLNVIMKKLTLISILLMIPTLVASIFGMNVPNNMEDSTWALPSIILGTLIISSISVMLFRKNKWF